MCIRDRGYLRDGLHNGNVTMNSTSPKHNSFSVVFKTRNKVCGRKWQLCCWEFDLSVGHVHHWQKQTDGLLGANSDKLDQRMEFSSKYCDLEKELVKYVH